MSKFRLGVKIIGVLALVYLTAFVLIYLVQDKFIFQRQILAQDHVFSHNAEEIWITTKDDIKINGLYFKSNHNLTKGLVLYFHGNRHSLQRWGRYASLLTENGYDVLMIDYRGYGKSQGKPSEKGMYLDALATYTWAVQNKPALPLVYYGRSLGTGVATHLAVQHQPQRIVLETPYDELKNVVPKIYRWLLYILPLRHTFKSNERVPLISCPILILHGNEDQIIPLESALGLKPLLKPIDQFIIVPGGRHQNLTRYDQVVQAIKKFLQ